MNPDLTLGEKVAGFSLLSDQVAIIEALAEVMDVNGDNLAVIESDVGDLLRITSEQRNTIYALTQSLVGIVAAMTTLKEQRDDAVRALHASPTADALYADFVARIVEANGCSTEAAQRIACILTAPDEELLTDDVVAGYATLDRFRAAVFAALNALDVEVL
jgi:hypothetical protein